jgi:hypothetical protein
MATSSSGIPNDGRGADVALFTSIWTHSSRRLRLNANNPMRKPGITGLAIVAATAFGVWSADTVANSKVAKAEAAAASAPISPQAIMVSLGSSLPSEYWSHPY